MIGGVVLAAGAATRFGAPKQRLLLPAVLERVQGVDQVVVVSGAYELEGPSPARTGSVARAPRCAAGSPRCAPT